MAAAPDAVPLVVVLGATAAGKTALAVALAQAFQGEIVSADAFAIYRGMDIGTAKPGPAEQALVVHHGVSDIEVTDRCDVQRWLTLAEGAISDIHARGRLAIVAGGTPLYVKALLEGLSAGAPRATRARAARRCWPSWRASIRSTHRTATPTISAAWCGRWRSGS